jgi:hypothetical protein
MAVQHRLGLLSNRRDWSHSSDRSDSLVVGRDLVSEAHATAALGRHRVSAHSVRGRKAAATPNGASYPCPFNASTKSSTSTRRLQGDRFDGLTALPTKARAGGDLCHSDRSVPTCRDYYMPASRFARE